MGVDRGASWIIIVMPLTSAFTSSRRFTLLKLCSARAITSEEMPQFAAIAAAALAFQTLYSPARGNSNSPHGLPFRKRDQRVLVGSSFRSSICHVAWLLVP